MIQSAPLFFVASVDPELTKGSGDVGPVNLSPKGGVKLHAINSKRVAYLDYPGSSDETARHAAVNGPITIMLCSFEEGDAAIVKLFGRPPSRPSPNRRWPKCWRSNPHRN